MTVKQLEYAIAVARSGSISRSSAELYVSQPTLSAAIHNLEQEVGFAIFERSHSGITLTAQGERFIQDAMGVKEQMDILERRYNTKSGNRRHFSVSSTHFYFAELVMARLSRELGGSFSLRLLDSRTLDVLAEVARAQSELGLLSYTEDSRGLTLREIRRANLESHVLCRQQPGVYLSALHPLAGRTKLTVEDLRPYPRSVFYQGQVPTELLSEELYVLPEWEKELVMQDNGAITIFLQETQCFSIGCGVVPHSIRNQGIVAIPLCDVPPSTILWVQRKQHEPSELAERFLALCKEAILEMGLGPKYIQAE